MKHLRMALTILFAVSAAEALGQNVRIGLDVGSLICIEAVRIDAEYGFSHKWSAGGEASIDIRMLKRDINTEEYEHRTDIDDIENSNESERQQGLQDASIFFQYWPTGKFDGLSLQLGGCIKHGNKADAIVGIGYSCRLRNGLGIGISLRTCLMNTWKTQKIEHKSLHIKLHYDF